MRISIITVCFNSAETIADTMRSVASQTHPDVEHIVVDGASSDNTLAIIQAFPSRPSRIVSERDAGIYDAMNKGLALATGEFVGFLNADDMLAGPNTVSNIAAAASRAEVDAIYGDLVYVHKDDPSRILRYWKAGACDRARLQQGWMPPHPTFYVKRSVYERLGPFDTRYRIAADYDSVVRFLFLGGIQVAYVPQVLVRMRVGGISNRSLASIARKSREDHDILRRHGVGGLPTLLRKNFSKLAQFWAR